MTVFLIGTFIAALLIGSVLALVLWVAVVIVLVAAIVSVAFRPAIGKSAR